VERGALHILPMAHGDEARLVEALRQGSPQAFESLYHLYVDRVAGLARLLLRGGPVDDAVQETFLRVFRSIATFREEARLTTWIHRIAINVCISELRKQSVRRAREGAIAQPDQPSDLEEATSARQAGGALLAILRDLEPAKQTTFYLHHVEGMSAAEIGDVLGEPRGTVLKRLQRTRVDVLERWRATHGTADEGQTGPEKAARGMK
jgi:RNA polymerase sigma-70 factor (ECF subfamily)